MEIHLKPILQLYLFCLFFYLIYLLYKRGYQRQYFWTLHLKVLAYESATAWNRGISCIVLKFLIKLYFFSPAFLLFLMYQKKLSEVRYFEIKWICWPLRQIQPETGESLVFFLNTDPVIFVTFISLFFDLSYQRGYQS